MRHFYPIATFSFALAAANACSQVGPLAYLQSSDSPWAANFGNGMFYLEDFEDQTLNTPGVSASTGGAYGPAADSDSVDGDDGVIDGFGRQGRSFFSSNAITGIRFTFTSGTYGSLPTHAGLVWTDGQVFGTTRFEAFDMSGLSLGVITGSTSDSNFNGGTGEDRFYGWTNSTGIGSILIQHSGGGGIEIDHLQYGAVPEPATMATLGAGLAILSWRRKSNASSKLP